MMKKKRWERDVEICRDDPVSWRWVATSEMILSLVGAREIEIVCV